MNTTRLRTHHSMTHRLLTVVGMTGTAALFLPFTYGYSPVAVLMFNEKIFDEELWPFALPSFLSVLASAASLRWIRPGVLSRPERALAYVVSATTAGWTLFLVFLILDAGPSGLRAWLLVGVPVATLLCGLYLLIRNARRGPSRGFNPVMAIQVAYLAYGGLFLIVYFGHWQVGAYCVLAAAGAFGLQIILISAQPGRLGGGGTGGQ